MGTGFRMVQYRTIKANRTSLRLNVPWKYERLTLSQTTNFSFFQTQILCRRQSQLDENGRKFSKWVDNTVGKGEIARYEQFLLFLQCFQKTYIAGT